MLVESGSYSLIEYPHGDKVTVVVSTCKGREPGGPAKATGCWDPFAPFFLLA
jgi:hypothetical protein